jgi:hypothetical protein
VWWQGFIWSSCTLALQRRSRRTPLRRYDDEPPDRRSVSDPEIGYEELANARTDTVKLTISCALSENVENLELIGKGEIDGVGSHGDNEIHRNIGNNRLHRLTGIDRLTGEEAQRHPDR